MTYPPYPSSPPPSHGKGMLPGILGGIATILVAAAIFVLAGFAFAAVFNLTKHIDYARTQLPTAQYESARETAANLAAFCLIAGGFALLAGAGVLVTSIIVWAVKKKKIVLGYSPHALLRLGMPAAALALALLVLLTCVIWRLASPEVSKRWRDAQIAQDIEVKRKGMEDAANQQRQAQQDRNRAMIEAQHEEVMALIRTINGDGDEAARQAAFNKLAGVSPSPHGGLEMIGTPAGEPQYNPPFTIPPRGSLLTADEKAQLRAGMARYTALFADRRYATLLDRFIVYFAAAEWPEVRSAILAPN